ncbi:MAG: class I SAM-dependent methyltransferase [Nitrospinae bacterium]|nr:class I SAM-dependent methyltransferase [Nitrospinota bacterium]
MYLVKMAHKLANLPFIKRALTQNRFFVRMYFNWRYRNPDPYHVSVSNYERDKMERVMASLGFEKRFGSILEIGCGEGNMTVRLASIADRVLATDISDMAVRRTRQAASPFSNVEAQRLDLLSDEAPGRHDLVVASEVLYYFEKHQLPDVHERMTACVKKGGCVALIHARALADDEQGVELKKFGARTIHEMFIGDPRYSVVHDDIQPAYRMTVLRRVA